MKKIGLSVILLSVLFAFIAAKGPGGPQDSREAFAKTFVTAFKKKDFKVIKSMLPGVEEWRILAPKQTDGLSNEEISSKVEASNEGKLYRHFHKLQDHARQLGVKVKELEYFQVNTQRYYEDPQAPVGMEIVFHYGNFHGSFSLAAVELYGKWYILDIEQPDATFETIRHLE